MLRRLLAALVILALTSAALAPAATAADTTDARKLVSKLKVTSEKSATKYQRSKFKHWIDADRNGCDTRREVLIAEARKRVKVGKGCWVTKGRWTSYFDNKKHTRASSLDIDHLVPLAEAWRLGASTWNASTRQAFANDLKYGPSLVAVTASVNRSKGDKDPASWLPHKNKCRYVSEWVGVKYRWTLSVDKQEKKAIARTLSNCAKSERLVPKPSKAKIGKEPTKKPKPPKKPDPPKKPEPPKKPDPTPTPTPEPEPEEPNDGVVVKTFANCTDLKGTYPNGVAKSEAAARGLRYKPFVHAKLYEANKKMDRDKDGIACERG